MTENDQKNYERTVLFACKQFEVVRCRWTEGSTSPLHGHAWSQCHVLIEEGTFENRIETGFKVETSRLSVGQVISTPVAARHEIKCLSPTGSSVHVYVPKIDPVTAQGQFLGQALNSEVLQLQEGSTTFPELESLLSRIRATSVPAHSPFFMNQLFSGITPEALMADSFLAETKATAATSEAGPSFAQIESEVIEKLGALIGWESGSRDGITVPGGSAANFMAIHCARQKRFPEFKTRGNYGRPLRVFVSKAAHYSFKKACVALGLGSEAVVEIGVDEQDRMWVPELERAIQETIRRDEIPLLVAATAGTTVAGAFDPSDLLADVCERYGCWLHVDGAWGGPVLFSQKHRALLKGIERADSMTFDAHKLLGASLTSSFFLCRHMGLLYDANDVSGGEYLFHDSKSAPDRGKMSWQCGRKHDAFSFWLNWKSNGSRALGDFVDRKMELREKSVEWILAQPNLELLGEPHFLNLMVRVRSRDSLVLREELRKDNIAMVNYSKDKNGTFLRLILAHPDLELTHIQKILNAAQGVET